MNKVDPGLHYPIDLDTLPPGWRVCYVGDAIPDIQPGFASGVHNQEGKGVPHLRPMNVDRSGRLDLSVVKYVANSDGPRLHSGDVLFNNTNSPELIGKTTSIDIDADLAFSNHMTRVRPPKGVFGRFVAHQLHFVWMSGYFKHRCVKHVNQASIASGTLAKSIPLILPPIDEQNQIVAEIEKQFTRLEAGIAGLRRVQANLKRYRAAVLKAACEGKLVPTEAELARQEGRTYETGAHRLERILTERRQKWNGKGKYKEPEKPDTSSLPELPEGWTWATVEQVNLAGRPCAYGVLQPGEDIEGGVPFVRVGDINNGRVETEELKRISPTIAAQYPRTKLSGGEFAITLVGAIGRTAIIPKTLAGGNVARAVGIVPLTESINANWIEIWFRNPIKISEMVSKSHEVARKTLNLEDVRSATIGIPPLAEQQRIVAKLKRRLSVVEELEAVVNANLQRATRLRQSILQRAFEGKLVQTEQANSSPPSGEIPVAAELEKAQ